MPPFSFVQATPSRTPCAYGLPTSEVMPVRSKMPPTLISCCAWADAATQRTNSAVAIIFMLFSSLSASIRKRVQPEPVAHAPPEIGEAVGLEDEEEHDGEPEHADLQGREDLHEVREAPGERAGGDAQDLRQEREEDRAEDRAEHAAEPADDDHAQVVDRERQRKVLRAGDPRLVCEQRPRDPDVERADREREQLVPEDLDAHHLGGDVLIADGHERLANARAEEVPREVEVGDAGGGDEEEEAPIPPEVEPEDPRRRTADARHSAGHRLSVRRGELDDEMRRER